MRKPALIIGVLLGLLVFLGIPPCDNPLLAVSGCCKERSSLSAPWSKTRFSVEECKARNEADGDSIFDPRGLYWWDVQCG